MWVAWALRQGLQSCYSFIQARPSTRSHNNSLVSHEEFNFVLKTQEDLSNLDNFVDLQDDVFTQNDDLSVFNDSYVENNHLEPKLPPVKGRLAKNIKFWKGINASLWVFCITEEGYALPFINPLSAAVETSWQCGTSSSHGGQEQSTEKHQPVSEGTSWKPRIISAHTAPQKIAKR